MRCHEIGATGLVALFIRHGLGRLPLYLRPIIKYSERDSPGENMRFMATLFSTQLT